jgi:hypothetical protein
VSVYSDVTRGENELANAVITESGLYAAGENWTRTGSDVTFRKFLPDGGRDLTYAAPPQTRAGGWAEGFSYAYHFDGSLWQVRPRQSGRFEFISYSPTGLLQRDRYATLPNQADFAIAAVASDGSLLGTAGRYAFRQSTFLRVHPLIGREGRLTNLSVRAALNPQREPLIAGFVTRGNADGTTLVRAIGPSLIAFGVHDAVQDPQVGLFLNGTSVSANDNWDAPLAAQFLSYGAFALAPLSTDAALESTTRDGNYTAVVSAGGADAGTALVELYKIPDMPRRFINISARSTVEPGRPLIAGFSISGEVPVRVLIRAAGPALAAAPFNLTSTLGDPKLTLYRGNSALWDNNDWDAPRITEPAEIVSTATAVGAFPFAGSSRDSAFVVTLAPGAYTALVTGSDGGSGMALVEVYEAP